MRLLILFLFFLPFAVKGQDWQVYIAGGINYNIVSSNVLNNYETQPDIRTAASPGKPSVLQNVFCKLGGQLGIEVEKYNKHDFFVGFFTYLEQRSVFSKNAYSITNSSSGIPDYAHLNKRSVILNPGFNIGFSPLNNLSFGSGISFPIYLTTFTKVYPDKNLKETSIDINSLEGIFRSGTRMAVNVPFFMRLETGKYTFLQLTYFRGITNQLRGAQFEKDNLFKLSFAIKV